MNDLRNVAICHVSFLGLEDYEHKDLKSFIDKLLEKEKEVIKIGRGRVEGVWINLYPDADDDVTIDLTGYRKENEEEYQARKAKDTMRNISKAEQEKSTLKALLEKHGLPEGFKP